MLLKKVVRIFSKIDEFKPAYDAVCRWQAVITNIAKLLEPSPDQTSESVRFHMEHLLRWLEVNYNQAGDEELVKNVQAYTRGFWKGLFTCYDAPHVPRTNNDHERFFRQT
ncbi:transposase, partial [Paenibacillus cremeus]